MEMDDFHKENMNQMLLLRDSFLPSFPPFHRSGPRGAAWRRVDSFARFAVLHKGGRREIRHQPFCLQELAEGSGFGGRRKGEGGGGGRLIRTPTNLRAPLTRPPLSPCTTPSPPSLLESRDEPGTGGGYRDEIYYLGKGKAERGV